MAEVASAFVSLVPSARGFGAKLQSQVGPEVDRAGRQSGSRFTQGMSKTATPGFRRIAAAASSAFAVLGAGKLFKFGLDIASQNEQAEISFTTMLGSARKARRFIKDLQAFAAKTPFDFPGLQRSASSLISIGVNAKDVIPIMTTLGNVTSGMGTGAEGVQRATVALQQMIAAQRISGEDLNQLRDAGIPVFTLLSKATGKSTAEIAKMAQKGKLGKEELTAMLDALKTGKGLERFNGLMDKQSQSLTGLASTFKDTFGQNLAAAMKPLIPLIKDGMGKASAFLAEQMPKASAALAGFIRNMQNGTGTAGKIRTALEVTGKVISKVFGFLAKHKETVITFVAVLGTMAVAFAAVNAVMAVNPISLVIIAIAALTTGLIMAYKHSETFRNIVNGAFHVVAAAIDFARNHWKLLLILITGPFGVAILAVIAHFNTVKNVCQTVFKFIVNAFLTVVGALVNGAAKAFGWVPGIGGKLKAAAKKFNQFRDDVNNALNGIHSVKEVHLKVTTQQVVLNPSLNKPRLTPEGAGATGAIIRRPTVALIGESGPEKLVPLSSTRGNSPLSAEEGGPRRVLVQIGAREFEGWMTDVADSRIDASSQIAGMQRRAFD